MSALDAYRPPVTRRAHHALGPFQGALKVLAVLGLAGAIAAYLLRGHGFLLAVALLVLVVLALFRHARRSAAFRARRLHGALLAYELGDLEGARAYYATLTSEYGPTIFAPMIQSDLATLLLTLGRLDEYRDVLWALERGGGAWDGPNRILAASGLVTAFTLLGELALASAWLDEARARAVRAGARARQPSLYLRYAEALLLARRDQVNEARAILDASFTDLEREMSPGVQKPLVLLRAYLCDRLEGPTSAAPWIGQLREAPAWQFSFVLASWPELATWATAQGLPNVAPSMP